MIEKSVETDEKRREMAQKRHESSCFHKKVIHKHKHYKVKLNGKEETYRKGR